MQASVFVSPDALNREAVKFLKQTGLIRYIRIIKAEEMDDDGDLKSFWIRQQTKLGKMTAVIFLVC